MSKAVSVWDGLDWMDPKLVLLEHLAVLIHAPLGTPMHSSRSWLVPQIFKTWSKFVQRPLAGWCTFILVWTTNGNYKMWNLNFVLEEIKCRKSVKRGIKENSSQEQCLRVATILLPPVDHLKLHKGRPLPLPSFQQFQFEPCAKSGPCKWMQQIKSNVRTWKEKTAGYLATAKWP